MPLNKQARIIDDAVEHVGVDVKHSTRIGLARNTVEQAKPVILTDYREILLQEPCMGPLEIDPILLHISGESPVSILIVQEEGSIACYPYRADDKVWKLYDLGFRIKGTNIELMEIHPWVEHANDITKETAAHIESLGQIVESFLSRLSNGEIELEEETYDFSKINKKRYKNDKAPVNNDWVIKWVSDSKLEHTSTESSEQPTDGSSD